MDLHQQLHTTQSPAEKELTLHLETRCLHQEYIMHLMRTEWVRMKSVFLYKLLITFLIYHHCMIIRLVLIMSYPFL